MTEELTAPVLAHLDREDPGGVVGVYLFGSAVSSGLRPDSDVDLLVLTRRSLSGSERAVLVSLLLSVSGWSGHADRFPDVAHRRPLELTSLVVDDVQPLDDHPRRDFQYGEWMREELAQGPPAGPVRDPDVVTLLATAQTAHRALRGPDLGGLLPPVSRSLLRQAILVSIPDVLAGAETDGRNTLLTLARMLVTLRTGRIVPKDEAVEEILPTLDPADRAPLARARDAYRGLVREGRGDAGEQASPLAHLLADRARRYLSGTDEPPREA